MDTHRNTTARLICTVTLSCVLQPFTGMLKTTCSLLTRLSHFIHGIPQWRPGGHTISPEEWFMMRPKLETSA